MSDDPHINPWTTLGSQQIYTNPWIEITEHKVLNPHGGEGIYGSVHFKNLAIGCIAIDHEGHTYLVGQYRYPLQAYSWEIPEGGGSRDTQPLVSAQRELAEETGLRAHQWQPLLEMDLSNSATDERATCFLAWDLEYGTPHPEEVELLAVKRVPFSAAYDMVMRGEIRDAMSVATILKLKILSLTGVLPIGLRLA